MTFRERIGPSPLARVSARRAEREFATRIDRTFAPDPAAIARVRTQLFGEYRLPARPIAAPRRAVPGLLRRGLPLAAAFALVVAAGLMAFNGSGGRTPTGSPPDQATTLAADLTSAATRLHAATAAVVTGDGATIEAALTAYRAGLLDVEADLQGPGEDLVDAAAGLQSQSLELAAMAGAMPVEEIVLYSDVRVELDRLIASLPTPSDHPGNTDHPTPSDHPGRTDHPTPSDHPGRTDHPTPSSHPTPRPKPTP